MARSDDDGQTTMIQYTMEKAYKRARGVQEYGSTTANVNFIETLTLRKNYVQI